jgi:hypothetical protein
MLQYIRKWLPCKLPPIRAVSDREVGCCLEPKENGVNPGGGDDGGPGPPGREQDKQLTASREGDNSIMEWEEDGKKGQA